MKKIIVLSLLFIVQNSFSQSVKIKFENIENIFTVNVLQESEDKKNILISDNTLTGQHMSFLFKEGQTQSTFVESIVGKMKMIAKKYAYQFNDSITLSIKNKNLTYKDFELEKPKKEIFSNLIKLNLAFETNDYLKGVDSILKNLNKLNFVFKNSKEFKFEKNDSSKINIIYKDSIRFKANSQSELINSLEKNYNTIEQSLKKLFIGEEKFNKVFELKLSEEYRRELAEIYAEITKDSDYSFINNIIVTDSIDKKDIVFNVSVKNNHSLKFYNLKFCGDNFKCQKSIKILYTTEKTTFKKIVNSFIKTINKNYTELDEDYMAELYLQVKAFNTRSIVRDTAIPFNEKIDSLLQAIENLKIQYSGKLKLNKEVRVYSAPNSNSVVKDTTFLVKYATVRFFNNKAKEVVLVGQLSSGSREFTVANVQFSLPLRSFRNSLNYVPISPNDKDSNKFLNYNDIFDYYPKGESSNYSARNKEYRIEVDTIVNIEERKLMDYFTAVVFSDFLGLNNQNANSLLQAEGRIKIPLWIHNFKKMSYFSSLYAEINATIYNGFDDNSRFITPIDVELESGNGNLISATINNFDYVKYNNVNAGIGLDILKLELKGLSTEWSFGYGLRYFRAGLRHTEVNDGVDEVIRFQLNALSHELSTNFEIRPQLNFGADLNIAMNWLNDRGSLENLDIVFNEENNNDKKEVLRLQLNLYSKLNPNESNGGVYARIGGFYHIGAKDFYPQILVGYATNLSSFVNKFKKN